jgi:hypothetical protein
VTGCGFDGEDVLCAPEPRVSVGLEILHDIIDPALNVTLEKGLTRCAQFEVLRPDMPAPLKAGTYTFEVTGIFLLGTDCPLPLETTRLVVRLWEVNGNTFNNPRTVLVQDLPYTYVIQRKNQ